MTSDEPATRSGKGRRKIPDELSALIREDSRALGGWIGLIVASLIAFWLTEGTQYHQLAAGLLMSSSTLLVLMALFECLWRLFVGRNP